MRLLHKHVTQGFTLIELVIVIIVLGVLATVAIPRFSSRSGFEDYTVRDQLIARLRLVQLQGMNADPTDNAASNACYWLVVKNSCFYQVHTTKAGSSCSSPSTSNDCDDETYNDFAYIKFPTGMLDSATYRFDLHGRLASGTSPIMVTGDNGLSITIEAEGFIHAP